MTARSIGSALLALSIAPAVAHAEPACFVGRLLDLPVTMVGRHPMVDAEIDDHPARFMVDSGAFFSLITPGEAAADRLRLEPLPVRFRIKGVGGGATASITHVKHFTLAGHTFDNTEFVVGGSEVGGAGLIGQNVLALADVEYDLANGMIRLTRAYGCGDGDLAYWAKGKPHSVVPLGEMGADNRHTIGTVSVNGHALRALFDSGAAESVLTRDAARQVGVALDGPDVRPAGAMRGLGRDMVEMVIAPVDSFRIGDEEVRGARLRLGDIGGGAFDMLIGADFFLSHRIYVANGQHRLYLTYNGGPVFDTGGSAADLPATVGTVASIAPESPADLARRAAALAARQDMQGALAAYDRAVALAPDDPDIRFGRARAHVAAGQPSLAAADLDAGLQQRPGDVDALMDRATLRLAAHDPLGARIDTDAADAAAPPQADERLRLADLYDRLGALDLATDQLSRWIAAHPDDSRRPAALAERCWSRTLAGEKLGAALDDCNAAIRMRPNTAGFLNARGLVRVRRGEWVRALADYDAALALEPHLPWALYGRGLAKHATGDKAGGDADIAAALALRPHLADQARDFGLGD